jgi:hypothetical protein
MAQRNSSDDWDFEDLPVAMQKGKWESDGVAVDHHSRVPGSNASAAVREVARFFRILWHTPRTRPLVLLGLLLLIGACVLLFVMARGAVNGILPRPNPTVISGTAQPTVPAVMVNQTPVSGAITPSRLTFRETSFTITPLQPDARGQWRYDKNAKNTAYWAPGTVINYVIGINSTAETKALFDTVSNNETLVLDTSIGTQRYRIDRVQQLKVDDMTPLRDQSMPQITLLLLGESGDTRKAIIARYSDEGSPNTLNPEKLPINLKDIARVRVNADRLIAGKDVGLTNGKNYLQVDFEITNLTQRALDVNQFFTQLTDGNGAKYNLSQAASNARGAAGWAKSAIPPGATINATAGYEVPDTLSGPRLEWTFALDTNTPFVARVAIPYKAQASASPSSPQAEINVVSASFSPDGSEVRIIGTIRNPTASALQLSLRDVTLTSGSNSSALNNSLPALPWVVSPGETLAFQVGFTRPTGGVAAVFTILGQSFEISGM